MFNALPHKQTKLNYNKTNYRQNKSNQLEQQLELEHSRSQCHFNSHSPKYEQAQQQSQR
jgi:hypothetical protein